MWLINTTTLQLEEFASHPKGEYAILSHRWEEGNEVNFQHWKARKSIEQRGCHKIMKFVQKAAERGLRYAWADTCCINRESSEELSEAINAMFKYYENSAECYVYLSDLPPSTQVDQGLSAHHTSGTEQAIEKARGVSFAESEWFRRGWTLQELIAPRKVYFFDCDWQFYGTKKTLKHHIMDVTGISDLVIDGSSHIRDCSIACRMSWAANRETTRVEDMAYCLLGIFDIHLPLLYGEGEEAFVRLQEKICTETTDMSLFAWKTLEPSDFYSSLLAISPANFRDSAQVALFDLPLQTDYNDEFAVTNRGVRFDQMSLHFSTRYGVLLDLHCCMENDATYTALFICVCRTQDNWVRCRANELIQLDQEAAAKLECLEPSRIFLRKTSKPRSLRSSTIFRGTLLFEFSPAIQIISSAPSHLWDPCVQGFVPNQRTRGAVQISIKQGEREQETFLILCGNDPWDNDGNYIHDWRQRYRFAGLAQAHISMKEIRSLIRKLQLRTDDGWFEIGNYLNRYARRNCCNKKDSKYFDHVVMGKHHKLSVQGKVVTGCGADGDSWDMVKLSVSCL
ncbi:heterokaryon incompatibility protein-domain-containing protein [Xylariaceae sp. FL1651]|nr:heterokaryon incompatibility protein-domain-containing protein [Xylariaceae sp. FL1651]